MTTIKDIEDYLQDLSSKHKLLLHGIDGRNAFTRFKTASNVDEITMGATENIVVVSSVNGQRLGEVDDKKVRRGISLVFASRADINGSKADAVQLANSTAEDIMFDFITRMDEDQVNDCIALQDLEPEKVSWDDIDGPWLDHYYGWILFVPFKSNLPPYNPDNWND